MDGLLIIDKPEGMTSHDVVARVRRILRTKRVGHTGTLDPFATGVLVLLIGKATRLAQFIDKDEKEYEAVIQFGFETDTGDRTGTRTTDSVSSDEEIAKQLCSTDWEAVLSEFRGEIVQIPPMYSAKKVAGKKLYELARHGKEIERKPVRVFIRELELIENNEIRIPRSTFRIRVVCSAGTYIRTLAEGIGRRVGLGAHLTELRRTRAGRFTLDQSVLLDELDAATISLLPIGEAVSHLPAFDLPSDRVERTRNGLPTRTVGFETGDMIRMLDPEQTLVAIGRYDGERSEIKPAVVVA